MESIKELRKICQPRSLGKEFLYTHYMRKISIYFTKFSLLIGLSANQATVLNITLTMLSLVPFLQLQYWWNIVLSAILYIIGSIFDHVDGEIARYKGSTHYGRLLDVVGHDLYYLLFIVIGFGLYLRYNSIIFVILGISATIFQTIHRLHEMRLEFMRPKITKKAGKIARFAYDISLAHTFLPVLYIFGFLDLLQYFLYFYGVYIPLFWIFWLVRKRGRIIGTDKEIVGEKKLWKDIRDHV